MDEHPRIYLDNGATSWPKPECVYAAVEHYQRHLGAPAGRAGYAEALDVGHAVAQTRLAVARLLGLAEQSHLIFTFNGTDSLNLVIHGVLRPGDHVITSVIEHNSVLRPLSVWEQDGRITVTNVPCDAAGSIAPDDVRAALRPNTRLVAICHASNVTGTIQPIAAIGRIAREANALFLCDAAQTVGHLPVDIAALGVDFLAASGHKGLLGPLGTGVLAIRPGAAEQLRSLRQGGTGTQSNEPRQPNTLPSKYESGNLNVPGIVGLGAGVEYLNSQGIATLAQHCQRLTADLLAGLREIPGVRILGPPTAEARVPLVSIVVEGYDPQELALALDAGHRIQVRSGLHCAPKIHEALGTAATGGTLRFSLGPFTTSEEITRTLQALSEIAASAARP